MTVVVDAFARTVTGGWGSTPSGLGWALAGEAIGFRSTLAAGIIVGSVIVIVSEAKIVSDRRAAPQRVRQGSA